MKVVAILETMWDWRSRTSGAGYTQAPRFFAINPANFSGRRLYKLIGPDAQLLVTNACPQLVTSASQHGKPDSAWLAQNLELIETNRLEPDSPPVSTKSAAIEVLLVCGKVAQETFRKCIYRPTVARIIEIPHPAARRVWTQEMIRETAMSIQGTAR